MQPLLSNNGTFRGKGRKKKGEEEIEQEGDGTHLGRKNGQFILGIALEVKREQREGRDAAPSRKIETSKRRNTCIGSNGSA